MKPDMSIKIGKIELKNPIMPASGTFGAELAELTTFNKFGAILPKSITLLPRQGNKAPRIVETASGMLNAVGIQNEGVHHFIEEVLPFYEEYEPPVIVSISAHSTEEFLKMVSILEAYERVDALELNISCPNLAVGGKSFGMSEKATYDIIKAIREITDKTIIAKLTPNVGDISLIAKAAEKAGADAVSLVNTFTAMAIDIKKRKPKLGNVTGGLSGPAIKPIALRMVFEVANTVEIPIIGIGGIMNSEDVIEFLLAGASAVQVGTASFVNPKAIEEIVEGLEDYMIDNNMSSLKDIVGKLIVEENKKTCN